MHCLSWAIMPHSVNLPSLGSKPELLLQKFLHNPRSPLLWYVRSDLHGKSVAGETKGSGAKAGRSVGGWVYYDWRRRSIATRAGDGFDNHVDSTCYTELFLAPLRYGKFRTKGTLHNYDRRGKKELFVPYSPPSYFHATSKN